jgi:SNF2 family DNA or RNA helicase
MSIQINLYRNYQKLDYDSQVGIKIAALIFEPFDILYFTKAINAYRNELSQKNVTNNHCLMLINQLLKDGYFMSLAGTEYRILPAFSMFLLDEVFHKDADITSLIECVKKTEPVVYFNYMLDEKKYYYRLVKQMQMAYFQDQIAAFEANWSTAFQYNNRLFSKASDLIEVFFPKPMDINRINRCPPKIRAFLLKHILYENALLLTSMNEYNEYIFDNLTTFEPDDCTELAEELAEHAMLRGDFERVKLLMPLLSDFAQAYLTAWLGLVQGNNEVACTALLAAQKATRKETGNSKAILLHLPALIQNLIWLQSGDSALISKIETNYKSFAKYQTNYEASYLYFVATSFSLKNQKKEAQEVLITKKPTAKTSIHQFFYFLNAFWVDRKLVDNDSNLIPFYRHLQTNGYKWLASEILSILAVLRPHDEVLQAELEKQFNVLKTKSLTDIVEYVDDWESALNAMIGLSSLKPASTAKENDSRVVWLLDFEFKQIQPKEQVFGKTGWSGGRNVSLTRVKGQEVKNMTPQDVKVAKAITVTQGGYYGNQEYFMEWEKAIPELIGHPLLFLMKSPAIALQLIETTPVLIAKEQKNGYELTFSEPITESALQVVKESPTRYKVLKIKDVHRKIAQSMNASGLFIPVKGKDKLQKVLETLSGAVEIQSNLMLNTENLPVVESDAQIHIHLLPVGDGFHVEFYVKPLLGQPRYFKPGDGETSVIGEMDGKKVQAKRNLGIEKKNETSVRNQVPLLKDLRPRHGIWELESTEHCLELLMQLNPLLEKKEISVEWPKGEKFKLSRVVGFESLSMQVKKSNDWFEVSGSLKVDDTLVLTMQEVLNLVEKEKSQFIELSPGKFVALTNEFRRRLREINSLFNTTKSGALQMHPLAAPALQSFTDLVQNPDLDKKYKESLAKLQKAFKKKFELPKDFNATLRAYQTEGFEWLCRLSAWGVGACLADDMGLGKTVQGLALIQSRASKGATLVLAPASVCRNWEAECRKFTPTLNPILFSDSDRELTLEGAGVNDLLITTYDLMARSTEMFAKKEFATIILDEAQAIKNRTTKRSEAAMQLQGDFKIIMTGTPMENHLGELWNLFQFINPGLLGSPEKFQEKFALPIEKNGDEAARDQLRKLLQPFMLRRKKDEVLKELPAKTEITLTVELSKQERAFYEALRRKAIADLESDQSEEPKHLKILAQIMRLRRAACHPQLVDETFEGIESAKLKLFGEVVEELLENGHKALVFSQFVGHLSILKNYLEERGIKYQYLDGQTPMKLRQKRIEAFQNGEGDLFLISLKAGGTGLNLTNADYVIHMDPWWNPAVEDQATDRAHRIGQEKPVTVYRLVTENTIEEKILKLHEQKRDLADSLLEGSNMSARLSADDLMNLLKQA